MIRTVRSIAVLLLLFAASAACAQAPQYRAICEIRLKSWQGSGTLIGVNGNQALVLSCRHVCEQVGNNVTCNWLWAGPQSTPGRVVAVVPGRGFDTDLALVICARPRGVAPMPVTSFNYANGPWVSAGFRDRSLRYAYARSAEYDGSLITFPVPYIQGMSGGPCYDRYGRIVAVVVASDMESFGISVDGPRLQALVNQFRK